MKETGVQFPLGVADRLCAYARSVGHFPTALKEYKVRISQFNCKLESITSGAYYTPVILIPYSPIIFNFSVIAVAQWLVCRYH